MMEEGGLGVGWKSGSMHRRQRDCVVWEGIVGGDGGLRTLCEVVGME